MYYLKYCLDCEKLMLCFCWNYRNDTFVILSFVEVYSAINECVKRIIFTLGNVLAREVLVSALAHDDIASDALLSTPNFHTKSL